VPLALNQEVVPQEDHPTNLTSQDLQITGAEAVLAPALNLAPNLDPEEDPTPEMTEDVDDL